MDFINEVLAFFQSADWTEIGVIAIAFLIAFERLAEWTPTDVDNKIVAWLRTVFSVLGLKKPSS